MNTKAINSLLMMGIITTLGLILTITENQALPKAKFICDTKGKFPTTFAFYVDKDKKKVIEWKKENLGGKSPKQRCQEVTPRLQKIYDEGNVGLITNGIMKGKNVICVAKQSGGICTSLLMNISPDEKPLEILNHLKEILYSRQEGPIKNSSREPQIYYKIDFEALFRNSPTEK